MHQNRKLRWEIMTFDLSCVITAFYLARIYLHHSPPFIIVLSSDLFTTHGSELCVMSPHVARRNSRSFHLTLIISTVQAVQTYTQLTYTYNCSLSYIDYYGKYKITYIQKTSIWHVNNNNKKGSRYPLAFMNVSGEYIYRPKDIWPSLNYDQPCKPPCKIDQENFILLR